MDPLRLAALVADFFVAGCQAAPEPRPAAPLRSHVAPAEAGPRLRCAHRDEVLAWLAGFGGMKLYRIPSSMAARYAAAISKQFTSTPRP